MKFYASPCTKNFTAILLFALLLFIHGVKFFHSHQLNGFHHFHDQESVTPSQANQLVDCPVCDFKLNNGLVVIISSIEPVSVYNPSSFFHFNAGIALTAIDSQNGRGPPAIL
jgi:hypothetical protein